MRIKISILEPTIKTARPNCPTTETIKALLTEKYDCYISNNQIIIYYTLETIKYELNQLMIFNEDYRTVVLDLPNIAKSKIKQWDKGRTITPYYFYLEIPDYTLDKNKII